MNTIKIETLGCRLNQIESEAAGRFFLDKGFHVDMSSTTATSVENTEVCLAILNTCTVTQKAEQKARRIIRLMLKKYPQAAVLVTGCYAQLSKEEILKMDQRICVIGGQIKSRIEEVPVLLQSFLNDSWSADTFAKKVQSEITDKIVVKPGFPEQAFKLSASSFVAHSRASLKIQDGCNSNCSYCAIHMARGHSVSLDVQTAIDRVKELEALGHSEVVLTTVNIGQYKGVWKDGYCNFTGLLKLLLENTSTISFRISSLYPEVVDDEFCKVIADKRVRPHFHISVQSGSDAVLKNMNRVYKSKAVLDACNKIKSAKNNPFLACDIITGFPGETTEDFEQTMDLCKKCNFGWIHAFPFSERPGTVAATLKNKVPQSVSGERAKQITEWAINQKITYIEQWCGVELEAILETCKRPVAMSGGAANQIYIYHLMTENFIHCEIQSPKILELNKQVKIKIIKPLPDRITKGGEIEALAQFI